MRYTTPIHTYYVRAVHNGIEVFGTANTPSHAIIVVLDNYSKNRKATPEGAATLKSVLSSMLARWREHRGEAIRLHDPMRGAKVSMTLEVPPRNWPMKASPARFERTNWDAVRSNNGTVRWK